MIKAIAPDTEVVLLTCDRSSDFVCSDEDSGTGFEVEAPIVRQLMTDETEKSWKLITRGKEDERG